MFKKWDSIENHYRQKFIQMFFEHNPDLLKEQYIVTEKLDGANFSIIVSKEGETSFARRGALLGEDNFFNYQFILEDSDLQEFIDNIVKFCKDSKRNIQFVGELFGPGINGRIQYGPEKQWMWYAVYEHFDDSINLISVKDHMALVLNDIDFENGPKFMVPVLDIIGPFESMEEFNGKITEIDIRKNSLLTPSDYDKPNMMEGAVIRPVCANYYSPVNELFIIKFKNPEYLDNPKDKKPKTDKPLSEEITNIIADIEAYVNDNRSKDLFSKHGEIDHPSLIGKYIKLYYDDIIQDFEKDFPIVIKELEDKKSINKHLNRLIVEELKRFL